MRASLKLPRLGGDAAKMELPLCLRPASEHYCATHKRPRPQTRDNITTARTGTLALDWREAGMCESRTSVALRSCGPARLPQLMLLLTRGREHTTSFRTPHIGLFVCFQERCSGYQCFAGHARKEHPTGEHEHRLCLQCRTIATMTLPPFSIIRRISDTASWWCLHQAYANKGHRLLQSHNLKT